MSFLGIDPGKHGAVAKIKGNAVSVYKCPLIGNEYDITTMARMLGTLKLEIELAMIERAQSMPKQGVVSTFTTGYGYGLWLGILTALGIPYRVVPAKEWQKRMLSGITGDNVKVKSVLVANRRFPPLSLKLSDHNTADAVNLADYGQMLYMDMG